MTALSAERGANQNKISRLGLPLAATTKAWKGAKVGLNLSTGKVHPVTALTTAALLVIGSAHETIDATAAEKELEVDLDREITGRWWVNSGVSAITAAHVGRIVYFEDDQTVALAPTAGAPIAGRVWIVSATRGVFVEQLTELGTGPAVGSAPAYVANDSILAANPPSGSVIDIPTTGAASTVTLPATAVEGTKLFFSADGTKNGHTVQYRDATGPVNLTTALTASKRHAVIAVFLGGKWVANAYVSP